MLSFDHCFGWFSLGKTFLNSSSKEASVLMKSLANLVAITALGASSLWAQALSASPPSAGEAAPPSDCIPASTNVIAAQYPCIYPDRRVMLRIKAPDAQHVQALIGGGGGQTPTMDMVKQPDGCWTLTTPPIVEGFHYYQFYVDGVEMGDPGSRTFFGEMREISGIEIPSPRRVTLFTRSRMCRMERSDRFFISRRWSASGGAASSTHLLITITSRMHGIRCCICCRAMVRMSWAGSTRGARM